MRRSLGSTGACPPLVHAGHKGPRYLLRIRSTLLRPATLLAAALALVLALLAAACVPSAASTDQPPPRSPTAPKRITVASLSAGAVVSGDVNVTELFTAGMVNFSPDGYPSAQLAETLPTVESGLWKIHPDGRMETTLTIRNGVKWHDGATFTTADLVFGAQVGPEHPSNNNFGSAAFANIERYEPRDDRTITVYWKHPYVQANWLFADLFALPYPRHLLEEAFLADKASFMNHAYFTSSGTGPSSFASSAPGPASPFARLMTTSSDGPESIRSRSVFWAMRIRSPPTSWRARCT